MLWKNWNNFTHILIQIAQKKKWDKMCNNNNSYFVPVQWL